MTESCVGCGATVEKLDGPIHRYMTSAPACWARYGELLGGLAVEPRAQVTRIMCVDAYAAQHPGTPNPQAIQSVAVHLINMHGYLVLHGPVTVPRVVGHKGAFEWMKPPSFASARTVFDMPLHAADDAMANAAREWAKSVWEAWAPQHGQIARWHAQYSEPITPAARSHGHSRP